MVRLLRVLLSIVWPCGPLLQAVRVEPFVFALRLIVLVFVVIVVVPNVVDVWETTIVVTTAVTVTNVARRARSPTAVDGTSVVVAVFGNPWSRIPACVNGLCFVRRLHGRGARREDQHGDLCCHSVDDGVELCGLVERMCLHLFELF